MKRADAFALVAKHGGKPREGFVKVPHSSPMLSLDNTYNEEELRAWERRVRREGRRAADAQRGRARGGVRCGGWRLWRVFARG